MKILVTGGCGFIGSNLAVELAKQGHKVTVLDDMFLGVPSNLEPLKNKITLKKGSVTDEKLVDRLTKGMDYVFHFASHSSAPMYEPDPRKAAYVTFNGFLNVLEAAKKHKVKKVIYASSSSVYGRNPIPQREDQAINPISFYISTKMAMEFFAEVYTNVYGLKTVALRFFSVFGPREKHKGKYANIVSQFLWDMQKGKAPVIYGDGKQTRDYVYVKDVVRANILAMQKNVAGVFNVGTGKAYSFNDVVNILNKSLGTNIKARYINNPIKNYVANTLADTKKAEKVLGFKAKYSLEEGLKDLLSQS